jgi:hypothetical protein
MDASVVRKSGRKIELALIRKPLVEAALCLVEAVRGEALDRVRGPDDDRLDVVLGRKWREDVVRDGARVTAPRAPDADP